MQPTLLELGIFCNSALGDEDTHSGGDDPLERALLLAAGEAGMDWETMRHKYVLRDEYAFDNLR